MPTDDPADAEFERWYGPWDPMSPADVAKLLDGYERPWWIVGGHAIEAFTGISRQHEDIDVGGFRRDVAALRAHLGDRYQAWSAGSGLLRPLNDDHPELHRETGQVWIRHRDGGPWLVDFTLLRDRDGRWVSNHDESIAFTPVASIRRGADGIPFLRPEITLAWKAKRLDPKDDADFGAAWPLLDEASRTWLHDTVERLYPKHPWLNRMAAPQHRVEIDGERVRLREATVADAALVDAWRDDPSVHGEFNDFGLPPGKSLAENLSHGKRMVGPERGQLLVVRRSDGTPIGDVSWHQVSYGPGDGSLALNIGVALVPDARGQGFGTEAQRLLASVLFDLFDIERIEASTDIENVAEQRSLDKAGFTREGVQRRAQFRAGAHHDLVTYSIVRDDLA